jgi:hypothetical protein
MGTYLFAFRGNLAADAPAAQEPVWRKWFEEIGPAVADMGHRVREYTVLTADGVESGSGSEPLTGFIQVRADSLDAAIQLAKGCPMLEGGGRVEVGETFD